MRRRAYRQELIRTESLQLGTVSRELEHVEERDERLVSDLLEEELEWVAVVRNARERVQDRAEHGAARDVADATDLRVGEDGVLMVVDVVAGLLDHGGRKAEGVGAVVGELRVNVLVHLCNE
jgi:hypothetical protein